MKKIFAISLLSFVAASWQPALAGGILTNTNQNIVFNRMMARDAAIGIDGVYSNPAGVAFLTEGWHLSLNYQYAKQTRTIWTTNPDFMLGMHNNRQEVKKFEGKADAPFIPSVQVAYNKGKWSLQGNIAIPGGGGQCEFDKGIGSFESAVGAIANQMATSSQQLNAAGIVSPLIAGYDVDAYMRGKQFYLGFTLGAAYKLTDNLSVYGGARLLYGTASYKARLENIAVTTDLNGGGKMSLV
nr:transporter [Bacteroidales bacterium]